MSDVLESRLLADAFEIEGLYLLPESFDLLFVGHVLLEESDGLILKIFDFVAGLP